MKLFDPLLNLLQRDEKVSDDTLLGKLISLKDNSGKEFRQIFPLLLPNFSQFLFPFPCCFIIQESNHLFVWLQSYLGAHAVANLMGLYGAYEVNHILLSFPGQIN